MDRLVKVMTMNSGTSGRAGQTAIAGRNHGGCGGYGASARPWPESCRVYGERPSLATISANQRETVKKCFLAKNCARNRIPYDLRVKPNIGLYSVGVRRRHDKSTGWRCFMASPSIKEQRRCRSRKKLAWLVL